MYLSRLTLDPRSAQARRDLSDPYDMHRTLARAFVAGPDSIPERFLWRIEVSANVWAKPQILVQSSASGNWAVFNSLPGYLQEEVENKQISLDTMICGDGRYRFRIIANPTVSRQGKRYGLVTETDQVEWIRRQGARHGFVVESVLPTANELSTSRKGNTRISIHKTCFDGILKISQPPAIRNALQCGIGPAKAFGCGMLSLARL